MATRGLTMMTRLGRRLGTCWLARLLRGRRLDRNPLRRGSDRAETVVLGVLLAAFLAAAPFAAHAAWALGHASAALSGPFAFVPEGTGMGSYPGGDGWRWRGAGGGRGWR